MFLPLAVNFNFNFQTTVRKLRKLQQPSMCPHVKLFSSVLLYCPHWFVHMYNCPLVYCSTNHTGWVVPGSSARISSHYFLSGILSGFPSKILLITTEKSPYFTVLWVLFFLCDRVAPKIALNKNLKLFDDETCPTLAQELVCEL